MGESYYFRGTVWRHRRHYTWRDLGVAAAFEHSRQGHFENCVFHVGCLASKYATLDTRAHSDGTWSWRVSY